MEKWTGEQRGFIVTAYLENVRSFIRAQREFRLHFHLAPRAPVPSWKAIFVWTNNLKTAGKTTVTRGGSVRTVRTPENVEAVRESFTRKPRRSARRHSISLGLSTRTVRRILHDDLHLHPYKIQIVHALNPTDYPIRVGFCEHMLQLFEDNQLLVHNLWMSDEANFHLSGNVNKQNFRYWAVLNPQELHERPLHSPKVTVWCAMSTNGIIDPYFFEDDNGHAVTVTSARYVQMLNNFLIPELRQFHVNEDTYFQQDGATSHTARVSMDLMRNLFPNRLISRNGDIQWPPRSPDLSSCDFFLWGYLKSKVFETRPATIQNLKMRITQEIRAITPEVLRRVSENFSSRLRQCVQNDGRHLTGVIFKK
ncbi:uncharacterized protein LOC120350562 [Nilaparvata lugens]|uniref:uncharacterized protein LOC120350562 n=1 Tax=Nilaparvata lugens TaxID=108931 RepID=UPI00193D2CE9|nr:uncharacterized protein LOC120350562 [Nilaparvata lugens]